MTLNQFLRGTAIASVFALFLIPFIVADNLFFPFITGKAFLFRIVVEIGFAAWLLLTFRDPAARPRKSALLWSFVAFVAVIGLADLFGQSPWKSFWSNFERMEGYVTIIHLFLYFLVAGSVLASEKMWRYFLQTSLYTSVFVSVYGIFQLAGKAVINQGGVRLDATFGNATYLGIFLVYNIFFALILIARDRRIWQRVVYGAIAVLHLVILYFTATRGAILGLLGGLLLGALLIALFDRGEKRLRIVAASAIGAVILLVLGFVAVKNASWVQHSPVLSRFASISWNDTKTQARAYIWPMALEGFKERPILGWGQENFNYVFNKNYDPRMYSQEQWFDRAHDVVLDWLIAGGALGLLAYLSLFASALYLIWRRSTETTFTEKALFTGLLAAYFFHNLFVFDNLVSYILFASVLALIHFKSSRLSVPIAGDEDMEQGSMRLAAPAVLLLLAFSLYFFNWRQYETCTAIIDVLRATSTTPVQGQAALDAFNRALSYDTLGRPELVERIIEAAPRMNSEGVSLDVRQKFYALAKNAVETQLSRFPGDARYEVFAASFYSMYGDPTNALVHFKKALELSPKKQSLLFQLGNFYVTYKQYQLAVDTFKQAYDLAPSYDDAARFYAVALVYNNQTDEAKALLKAHFGTDAMTDDVFVRAYADQGDWNSVISILKTRIAADPKNMADRQNLVGAYIQSGNKAGAIAAVRDMEALDPSFKAQGDALIQQIQTSK